MGCFLDTVSGIFKRSNPMLICFMYLCGKSIFFTLSLLDIGYEMKKVQVGKDQEKAQSEKRFPLQKPRWEKEA